MEWHISKGALEQVLDWVNSAPTAPAGKGFKRFEGVTLGGNGRRPCAPDELSFSLFAASNSLTSIELGITPI